MIVLGIDPGLSGACALLHGDSMVAEVFDTPTLEVVRNGKRRREYQIATLCQELIERIGVYWSDVRTDGTTGVSSIYAYLESVNAFPGQGVTSMFSLGRGLGIWEGVLAALNIPYTKVLPQVWKRTMLGGKTKQAKESSRLRAQQLFPSADLSRKRDHGRAEALLIAEWGRSAFRAT